MLTTVCRPVLKCNNGNLKTIVSNITDFNLAYLKTNKMLNKFNINFSFKKLFFSHAVQSVNNSRVKYVNIKYVKIIFMTSFS